MSFQVTEIDSSSELGAFLESRSDKSGSGDNTTSTKLFIRPLKPNNTFGIVVQQSGRKGYILYEGNDLLEARKAFRRLQQAMSLVFVNDSHTLPCTEELLKPLILPEPIEDKRTLLERLMNEGDSTTCTPDNQEVLSSIIESLLTHNRYSIENREMQDNDTVASACSIEEVGDEDFGDKIISFWGNVTSKMDDWACDLSSLLDELGDDMALQFDNICNLQDEELGDQIWESYFAQIKDMVMEPVNEGKRIAASAFQVSRKDTDMTLILAVKMGYVDTAMQLLLQDNNPNEVVSPIGTPLHMAVITKREIMVKLLLIFNADPTIKNEKNKTPIDLAKPGTEMHDNLTIAKCAQEKTRKYFDSHKSLPHSTSLKGTYLLSLDGGGVRAFNIAQYMIAVEDRMKQLSLDAKPFSSYFDYIAGTSSGGISSLVMLYTKHNLRVGRYLSYEVITKVFRKGLKHREKLMKEYLHGLFGQEKVMADLRGQRVIITGTLANENPLRLHLMTNYDKSRDDEPGPEVRKVWEAACITSSAPYYFPAFDGKLLDGGLMANNPTLAAMTKIIKQDKKVKFGYILSLGSGELEKPKPVEDIDFFMPGFSLKTLFVIPNALKGLINLVDLFVDQVTQSNGQCVQQAQAWSDNSGWDYIRWRPPLSHDINPAETKNESIIDMLYNTQMYILNNPDSVDNTAKHLLTK